MQVLEVSSKEYKNYFNKPYHIFNSVEFNELNKEKAVQVHYLTFRTSKVKLGLVLGRRDNTLYSPFSAPFGGFSFVKNDVSISFLDDAIVALTDFAKSMNCNMKISIPPNFYENNFITKCINSFSRSNFNTNYIDINHYFSLKKLLNYYESIQYNAKKNLKTSEKSDFIFEQAYDLENKKLAYKTIKENRQAKGYPLHMSLENVLATIDVVKADFFNLLYNGESVAAAQIFHVSENAVQIIYWGDKPGFESLRPMNFLAYHVVEYYKNIGIEYIDIGPSSESGVPNYGLCDFKESIGASVANKYTFYYENNKH